MRSNKYSKKVILLLAASLLALSFAAIASAQSTEYRPDCGFLPSGIYSISQTESVNDSTGTVTARIPLAKVAGKNGSGLSLDLVYNSALYNLKTQHATEDVVVDYNTSMGTVDLNMLSVSMAGGWHYSHRYALETDSRMGTNAGYRLTLVAGDGASHQLWLRVPVAGQNYDDGYSVFDITGQSASSGSIGPNLTYYTTDGSFIRVEINGTAWYARFPNGDAVSGPIVGANPPTPKDADNVCEIGRAHV